MKLRDVLIIALLFFCYQKGLLQKVLKGKDCPTDSNEDDLETNFKKDLQDVSQFDLENKVSLEREVETDANASETCE